MPNEYVALQLLKNAFKITDDDRDNLLSLALASASRAIDRETGRRFWLDATPTVRTYRPTGRIVWVDDGCLFLTDDIGNVAELVVEVGKPGAWTAVTDFETQPDNALVDGQAVTGLLRPNTSWPRGTERVRVTARFGWPAVPDEIQEATLILASRLYKRKDSPEGVLGSAEWGAVRLSRTDPDVYAMISHLIVPGFG